MKYLVPIAIVICLLFLLWSLIVGAIKIALMVGVALLIIGAIKGLLKKSGST